MNAYEKAQQLGLTGTDAEIVAILKTLTQADIPGKALGKWLGERNLLSWSGDKDNPWFGTLQTLLDTGVITGEAADGIKELKAVLIGPRGDGLATTDPDWSQKVFTTITGIAAVSENAAALIDSFYALDGGRPYKDLTTAEYAAQRSAAALQAHLESVVSRCEAAAEAAREEARAEGATNESITAAAEAAFEVV